MPGIEQSRKNKQRNKKRQVIWHKKPQIRLDTKVDVIRVLDWRKEIGSAW